MLQSNTLISRIAGPAILLSTLLLGACTETTDDQAEDITSVNTNGATSINSGNLDTALNDLPLETVSSAEAEGLYYMREEEKLAHDVYTVLYSSTGQNIFNNISDSEQTHTDAIKALIERYSLIDPVTDITVGVFQNTTLQGLYDSLVAQGSASLIDALIVGAIIEEVDIIDIQTELDTNVDNQDIALVYENLLKGSRNHLRSFIKNLVNKDVNYTPQYLDQAVYDSIINSPLETGN
jgi:hypothetical protein